MSSTPEPQTAAETPADRESHARHSDRSRSHSSSRRRRHSRRRRRHRRHRKISERNFAAAACSMVAIVGICTALAKSECFTFHGSDCQESTGNYLDQLGISVFFDGAFVNGSVYHYTSFGYEHYLHNCLDSQTTAIMRAILALCILSMALSVTAFLLDLIGPKQKHPMIIRRNGVLNIVAVFLMVTACGLCYWASLSLFDYLHTRKRAKGSKVYVNFGVSYYILVGAAVANILAAAFNLLRRYPPREPAGEMSRPILSDMDLLIASDAPVPPAARVHEPPPYAP